MTEIPLYPWYVTSDLYLVEAYERYSSEVRKDAIAVTCSTRHAQLIIRCELPHPVFSNALEVGLLHGPYREAFRTSCQIANGGWMGRGIFKKVVLVEPDFQAWIEDEAEFWAEISNSQREPEVTDFGSNQMYVAFFEEHPEIKKDFATSLVAEGLVVEGWEYSQDRVDYEKLHGGGFFTPIVTRD